MFDSGGSSGQLRDELGVLPPGDVLKCALTLARNEREARKILLARLPMLEHGRLAGSHRRQPAALDDGAVHRRLPRGRRRPADAARLPRPRVADHGRAVDALRDRTRTARRRAARWTWTRGRRGAARSAGCGSIRQCPSIRRSPQAIRSLDAVVIGPGSFFTSLLPILLVDGCREALAEMRRADRSTSRICSPKGGAWPGFTAGDAIDRLNAAIGRPIDAVDLQHRAAARQPCSSATPASTSSRCRSGRFPTAARSSKAASGAAAIARHDRRRLRAAVWASLAARLLTRSSEKVEVRS